MGIKIQDYVNVEKRAVALNCNIPTGIAILPRNFDVAKSKDELIHESSTATIRILWRQEGIIETTIEKDGTRFPYIQEDSFDWIAPTIFIGALVLQNNQEVISTLLKVMFDYISERLKGLPKAFLKHDVRIEIVKEETKDSKGKEKCYKKIIYEGDREGIKDLKKVIGEI